MRYDTFTIHAVGDYTSVESQEAQQKCKDTLQSMPLCLWSLRQSMIPVPIAPFLEMARSSKRARSLSHAARCCMLHRSCVAKYKS